MQTTEGTVTNLQSTIQNLDATEGTVTNLQSTNSTIQNLDATEGTVTNLQSTNSTIQNLDATEGTVTNLQYTNSIIQTGTVTTLTSTDATVANIEIVKELNCELGKFKKLDAEQLLFTNLSFSIDDLENINTGTIETKTIKAEITQSANIHPLKCNWVITV